MGGHFESTEVPPYQRLRGDPPPRDYDNFYHVWTALTISELLYHVKVTDPLVLLQGNYTRHQMCLFVPSQVQTIA